MSDNATQSQPKALIPCALYHGTSQARLEKIRADGVLRCAPFGVEAVSMTDTPEVARYFADLAADCDKSEPIVLLIDGASLAAAGYDVESFSDEVWGSGECDWERETLCWQDIPISFVTGNEK